MPACTRLRRTGTGCWTRAIESGRAVIAVDTQIDDADPRTILRTRLRDPAGRIVAEARSAVAARVGQTLTVRVPRLWSPDSLTLYTLETALLRDGEAIDRIEQAVGIRIVTFDAQRGIASTAWPPACAAAACATTTAC